MELAALGCALVFLAACGLAGGIIYHDYRRRIRATEEQLRIARKGLTDAIERQDK